MDHFGRPGVRNRLLSLLSGADFDRLRPHLEAISLPQRMHLVHPDEPVSHVYFPNTGIGSIVAMSSDGRRAEAGIFGCDGMCPTAVALKVRASPFSIFMQVEGEGFRIEYEAFADLLKKSPDFESLLLRYVHTLLTQVSCTAFSNAVQHIEERLARWILMCHDRTDHNAVALTHEFLAVMLAVRRSGVTTALHGLEGRGLIKSERGLVIVRDRKSLEAFAGSSYGQPELEYSRWIGQMVAPKRYG